MAKKHHLENLQDPFGKNWCKNIWLLIQLKIALVKHFTKIFGCGGPQKTPNFLKKYLTVFHQMRLLISKFEYLVARSNLSLTIIKLRNLHFLIAFCTALFILKEICNYKNILTCRLSLRSIKPCYVFSRIMLDLIYVGVLVHFKHRIRFDYKI